MRITKYQQYDRRFKYGKMLDKTLVRTGVLRKAIDTDKALFIIFALLLVSMAVAMFLNRKVERPYNYPFGETTVNPKTEVTQVVQAAEIPTVLGGIEGMICNPKYKWDCKKMIAICKVENGYHLRGYWKEDMVFDENTDGSVDTGICSINSAHGYTVAELQNAEENIEVAYKVWVYQGYEAWVVTWDDRHITLGGYNEQ